MPAGVPGLVVALLGASVAGGQLGAAVGTGVALVPVDGVPCAGELGAAVGPGVALAPVDGAPCAGELTPGEGKMGVKGSGMPGHLPQVIWQYPDGAFGAGAAMALQLPKSLCNVTAGQTDFVCCTLYLSRLSTPSNLCYSCSNPLPCKQNVCQQQCDNPCRSLWTEMALTHTAHNSSRIGFLVGNRNVTRNLLPKACMCADAGHSHRRGIQGVLCIQTLVICRGHDHMLHIEHSIDSSILSIP